MSYDYNRMNFKIVQPTDTSKPKFDELLEATRCPLCGHRDPDTLWSTATVVLCNNPYSGVMVILPCFQHLSRYIGDENRTHEFNGRWDFNSYMPVHRDEYDELTPDQLCEAFSVYFDTVRYLNSVEGRKALAEWTFDNVPPSKHV